MVHIFLYYPHEKHNSLQSHHDHQFPHLDRLRRDRHDGTFSFHRCHDHPYFAALTGVNVAMQDHGVNATCYHYGKNTSPHRTGVLSLIFFEHRPFLYQKENLSHPTERDFQQPDKKCLSQAYR
ncbi:hypothetical protein V8G54_027731 [Vigna mungo]|uniref:Uncharacterized protein n=1 Tax=Vigna mungo TaxID=3915 RepID=A0AAQ3MRA0_VIGMU